MNEKKLTMRDIEEMLNDSDFEFEDDFENVEVEIPQKSVARPLLTDVVIGNDTDIALEQCDDDLNLLEPGSFNEVPEVDFVDHMESLTTTEKKSISFRRGVTGFENKQIEYLNDDNSFDIDLENSEEPKNTFPSPEQSTVDELPFDYFCKYVPLKLFQEMSTYTNIYAHQNNNSMKQTTAEEMMHFVGIHIIMGAMKLPQINMYWNKNLRIESVASVMGLQRFYQLRTNIHFVNNLEIPENNKDKFNKVRPLIDSILKRCREMPVEKVLSVDEQIIPLTGRLNVKQYIKGKPCPWGIKNYVLCGKSGYPYDFVLYQGSNTEISTYDSLKFGHGAAVILHLSKRLNKPGHLLFFDNFFSTYQLFEILRQRNINATGTIRTNRFQSPQFLADSILKKKGRGSSDEMVSRNGDIVAVKWQDNKAVHLASNYVGKGIEKTVSRFDKKEKCIISIEQPEIVRQYNNGMGGVDLCT